MTDRKKPGWAFWATVVAVAFPVLYVAGYSLTVRPIGISSTGWSKTRPIYSVPFANSRHDLWGAFFAPAHAVDRRIRPRVWPNDRYGRLHSERMATR